jgi:hypothetical protein
MNVLINGELNMKKLIIPAAKYVPNSLQNVGKIPAIIYPINQTIVFDIIYKQYSESVSKINIVCCEGKDEVHKTLQSYDSKISIIDIDELKDLGHTIFEALNDDDSTVIINYADTIILDDMFGKDEDIVLYSIDYMSETWSFFDEKNGQIINIYDKKKSQSDERKKLFIGAFQLKNGGYLKDCLNLAFKVKESNMNSFYLALMYYSQKYPLDFVEEKNWYDIGHAENYYSSKLAVEARTFNHISIDRERGILKKSSDDREKFIGEIQWYLKLPADLEYVRPRIYASSMRYDNPYVEMEYYAYHTVHELYLYGTLTKSQWREIFKRILFICEDFKRYSVSDNGIKDALNEMYLTKTINRLERLRNTDDFERLFDDSICINGVTYLNLTEIENILGKIIPVMLFDINEFNIIHGDLCFTNILVDNNFSFIKVIDPRGKFGKYDIYGDVRYELAKLFHSIDGKYDYIIKNKFNIEKKMGHSNIFNYSIDTKNNELTDVFLDVFGETVGNNLKKIELIEALLFLSMIPLHAESKEQ